MRTAVAVINQVLVTLSPRQRGGNRGYPCPGYCDEDQPTITRRSETLAEVLSFHSWPGPSSLFLPSLPPLPRILFLSANPLFTAIPSHQRPFPSLPARRIISVTPVTIISAATITVPIPHLPTKFMFRSPTPWACFSNLWSCGGSFGFCSPLVGLCVTLWREISILLGRGVEQCYQGVCCCSA